MKVNFRILMGFGLTVAMLFSEYAYAAAYDEYPFATVENIGINPPPTGGLNTCIPTETSSVPGEKILFDGRVFFAANDMRHTNGRELLWTDGEISDCIIDGDYFEVAYPCNGATCTTFDGLGDVPDPVLPFQCRATVDINPDGPASNPREFLKWEIFNSHSEYVGEYLFFVADRTPGPNDLPNIDIHKGQLHWLTKKNLAIKTNWFDSAARSMIPTWVKLEAPSRDSGPFSIDRFSNIQQLEVNDGALWVVAQGMKQTTFGDALPRFNSGYVFRIRPIFDSAGINLVPGQFDIQLVDTTPLGNVGNDVPYYTSIEPCDSNGVAASLTMAGDNAPANVGAKSIAVLDNATVPNATMHIANTPAIRHMKYNGNSGNNGNMPFLYYVQDGPVGRELQTRLFRTNISQAVGMPVRQGGQRFPHSIKGLTVANSFVYYSAIGSGTGVEVWRTNGSPVGYEIVENLTPGFGSTNPVDFTFMVSNGVPYVYFLTHSSNNTAVPDGLYRTVVVDHTTMPSVDNPVKLVTRPNNLTLLKRFGDDGSLVEETLYFGGDFDTDFERDNEIWVSSGESWNTFPAFEANKSPLNNGNSCPTIINEDCFDAPRYFTLKYKNGAHGNRVADPIECNPSEIVFSTAYSGLTDDVYDHCAYIVDVEQAMGPHNPSGN